MRLCITLTKNKTIIILSVLRSYKPENERQTGLIFLFKNKTVVSSQLALVVEGHSTESALLILLVLASNGCEGL